jgi:hypothetical protein
MSGYVNNIVSAVWLYCRCDALIKFESCLTALAVCCFDSSFLLSIVAAKRPDDLVSVSKVLCDVRVVFSLRAYPVIFHVLCVVTRVHLLQVSQTSVYHEAAVHIKLHEVTC